MRKIKILLFMSLVMLLTGCSATYNLNITQSKINESLSIEMNDTEYNKFMENDNNKYLNMYYDDNNNISSEGIKLPLAGVKYYNYTDNEKLKTITYEGSFNYNDFSRSTILKSGFNNVDFIVRNNELHISTSEGFSFTYENLNEVKIILSSDFKVMNSNADKIESDNLIWIIDNTNYQTKKIIVDYKLTKSSQTNDNKDNNIDKDNKKDEIEAPQSDENDTKLSIFIVIIGFISFLLVLFGILILSKRNK